MQNKNTWKYHPAYMSALANLRYSQKSSKIFLLIKVCNYAKEEGLDMSANC